MRKLEIERLSDYYDCEQCGGGSGAEGARFILDGEIVKELIPRDHCFGGDTWSEQEIMQTALEVLGVTDVKVELSHVSMEDEEEDL